MDKQMLGIINAGEENRKLKTLYAPEVYQHFRLVDVIVQLTLC
mgnify:CR=1 FL=1